MEDSGNVFFYAALIVIAFISWVVGKVREAVEAMRERKEYKERPIRTDIGPPTRSSTPPPPQISQRDRAKEAMRETYRALGIPFPEDEEAAPTPTPTQPPPQKSRPPAKRTKKAVAAGDQLTAAERNALKRLQQKQKQKVSSGKGTGLLTSVKVSNNGDADRLRQLLRNRSAIRQAILLKEILDKPKSLRTETL